MTGGRSERCCGRSEPATHVAIRHEPCSSVRATNGCNARIAAQRGTLMDQLRTFAANGFPRLLTSIAILVVGWIVAAALGAILRAALHRTGVDDKIARTVLGDERAAR